MTTLVNRDVVVRDVDGNEVAGRCIGQSPVGYWIKLLLPDGTEMMASAADFVRMAATPSQGVCKEPR